MASRCAGGRFFKIPRMSRRVSDMLDVVLRRIVYPGLGLLLGLVLEAFLGAGVSLFLAQAVDGTTAGQRDDPAQGLALLRGVVRGLVPDLHVDFLEQVVRLGVVVDDAHDQGFQDAAVAVVQGCQRLAGSRSWMLRHQGFVARRGRAPGWKGSVASIKVE